ncbi:MAG: hypothetical protein CO108_22450 [Deltaproteobacteria bacterium CG_4_9_14_3_um_filter_63_12]|nr:MAG: hypothetical protein CO108_22450 [Deltaproteobacteria bacterium CG_4_9_14_3_um_filter_63_12]
MRSDRLPFIANRRRSANPRCLTRSWTEGDADARRGLAPGSGGLFGGDGGEGTVGLRDASGGGLKTAGVRAERRLPCPARRRGRLLHWALIEDEVREEGEHSGAEAVDLDPGTRRSREDHFATGNHTASGLGVKKDQLTDGVGRHVHGFAHEEPTFFDVFVVIAEQLIG